MRSEPAADLAAVVDDEAETAARATEFDARAGAEVEAVRATEAADEAEAALELTAMDEATACARGQMQVILSSRTAAQRHRCR
jgi:predicted Zn-dependent protease